MSWVCLLENSTKPNNSLSVKSTKDPASMCRSIIDHSMMLSIAQKVSKVEIKLQLLRLDPRQMEAASSELGIQ